MENFEADGLYFVFLQQNWEYLEDIGYTSIKEAQDDKVLMEEFLDEVYA